MMFMKRTSCWHVMVLRRGVGRKEEQGDVMAEGDRKIRGFNLMEAVDEQYDWWRTVVLTPPRLWAETGTWSLCSPGPSTEVKGSRERTETQQSIDSRDEEWNIAGTFLTAVSWAMTVVTAPPGSPVPAATSRWARGVSWCRSRLASLWAAARCWPALYLWSSPGAEEEAKEGGDLQGCLLNDCCECEISRPWAGMCALESGGR